MVTHTHAKFKDIPIGGLFTFNHLYDNGCRCMFQRLDPKQVSEQKLRDALPYHRQRTKLDLDTLRCYAVYSQCGCPSVWRDDVVWTTIHDDNRVVAMTLSNALLRLEPWEPCSSTETAVSPKTSR